jgi:hypothetical protein
MDFSTFNLDNAAHVKTFHKDKLKATCSWFNYSDKKWVFSLNSLFFNKNKQQIDNKTIKILLLPENTRSCINKINWSLNKKNIFEAYPFYNSIEAIASSTCTPFVLQQQEEEVQNIGLGVYSTSLTKRRRYKIEISQLFIKFDNATVYNIVNSQIEVDFV